MTNEKIRPILKQILNDTPVLTLAHHNSIMTKLPMKALELFGIKIEDIGILRIII